MRPAPRPQLPVAIVFDMDGTLFDSSAAVPDAYIAAVGRLGGRTYTRDEIVQAYSVGPAEAILGHLLERPGRPEDVAAYHDALRAVLDGVRVYPGIEETLRELAGIVPLAVFTGADASACRMLLEAAGLRAFFRVLVGGDEVERPKPAPDGVEMACRRLGVAPRQAAYVGDAPNDLEAARRSGALGLAAGWGHQFVREAPADVVLSEPEDLLELVRLG